MNQPFVIKLISWLLPFFVLLAIRLFPERYTVISSGDSFNIMLPIIPLLVFSLWLIYITYVAIAYRNKIYEILTQVFTMFSLMWLLVLVESDILRWFFIIVSIPFFFFLVWMNTEHTGRLVYIKEKPLRRIRMMIHVFNMYAGCIALFAFDVYFPSIPLLGIMTGFAVYGVFNALLIWKLYFKSSVSQLALPLSMVGLVIVEYVWAIRLMPFGYLARGLLVVWIWYVVVLFIRFHLTPRGIIWKSQIMFIVSNVLLFILVLFFIRWI